MVPIYWVPKSRNRTVGFRVSIDGLVQRPEVKLRFVVGKEIQQAKKFPMHAPGRGDNRGEENATRILCRPDTCQPSPGERLCPVESTKC